MDISNVGASQVYAAQALENTAVKSAQPQVSLENPVDTVELTKTKNENTEKTGASVGKKVGVGIASAFVPGLGQLINGEGKKGAAYLGGYLLSAMIGPALLGPLTLIPSTVIAVASIVDAVKNTKA